MLTVEVGRPNCRAAALKLAGGTIGTGDVQWMTAGSGLLHEEFHSEAYARRGGPFEMIQLWVNLPARVKMTAPAYQGITNDQIPQVPLPDEAGTVRVIAGRYDKIAGAARTFTPMNVWDMRLQAGGACGSISRRGTRQRYS